VNVGIVSSRVLIRKALWSLLVSFGKVVPVLEVNIGPEALATIKKIQPEILILDSTDPPSDIRNLSQLKELFPAIKFLVITDTLDDEFSFRALKAGASGCVHTSYSPCAMERALKAVAQGETWLGGKVANGIIAKFILTQGGAERVPGGLTRRELEVLRLLANGYRNKEIASSLFVSEQTVRTHLKSIYKKIHLNTRHGAALHYFHHVQHWAEEQSVAPQQLPADSLAEKPPLK
jgi:two-component system, NarL family, response regulator DegU